MYQLLCEYLKTTVFFSQVIAALFSNATLAVSILEGTQFPGATEPITAQFITQWLKDTDCFLG